MPIDMEKVEKFVNTFSLWCAVAIYIPTYYLNIIPVRQIEVWLNLQPKN